MIIVGSYVKMTKDFKLKMMNPCLDRGYHFEYSSEEDCINCSAVHIKEFENSIGKVIFIDNLYGDLEVRWLPTNLKYLYLPGDLELVNLNLIPFI